MNEQKKSYLHLFGLSETYTLDELTETYRTLAKLHHPDLNSDSTAEMRMVILNEGYNYLREHIIDNQDNDTQWITFEGDDAYVLYREGIERMGRAFDRYYDKKSSLKELKEQLIIAKSKFSVVVKNHLKSDWLDDSIDKICSINRWID